jgi:hypothetical protein
MKAQEGLAAAAAASADSTPDLAFEESAESAAPEEDKDASPSVVLLVTDPVSVEPLHDTLASINTQLSQSLATLTAINHVEAEISKYVDTVTVNLSQSLAALKAIRDTEAELSKRMATIEDLQTAIDYLDHCIAVDLDESVAARMQDL